MIWKEWIGRCTNTNCLLGSNRRYLNCPSAAHGPGAAYGQLKPPRPIFLGLVSYLSPSVASAKGPIISHDEHVHDETQAAWKEASFKSQQFSLHTGTNNFFPSFLALA